MCTLETDAAIDDRHSKLRSLSLIEFLQADSRPSLVLDLETSHDADQLSRCIVFTNKSFETLGIAQRQGVQQNQVIDFLRQCLSVQPGNQIEYHHYSWSITTVCLRWCIVTGCPGSPAAHHKSALNYSDQFSRSDPAPTFPFCDSTSPDHLRLMQNVDWSTTSLGCIKDWSQLTRDAISFMLDNPEPCLIVWGPERTIIYNEPYIELIGTMHPSALGASARVVYQPFWPPYEEVIQQIEKTGRATQRDTYHSVINRSGMNEDLYFRATFVPIRDGYGRVYGVINQCIEITVAVVAQRRMKTLLKVAEASSAIAKPEDIWSNILLPLQFCVEDLPAAAIYSSDQEACVAKPSDNTTEDGTPKIWHLRGAIGFPDDHIATTKTLTIAENTGLAAAIRLLPSSQNELLLIRKESGILPANVFEGYTHDGKAVEIAGLVLRSISSSAAQNKTCLVIALKATQRFDQEYQQFITLLARTIEDIATSALLLRKERLRLERAVEDAQQQQVWLLEQLALRTQEIQASEYRFYNFAKHAPVGVFIVGPKGDVQFANNSFYHLLGLALDNTSLLPWRQNIHPDDISAVDQSWVEIQQGKSSNNFEFRVARQSADVAEITYLRTSAFAEMTDEGKLRGMTGVIIDISAQKRHEADVAIRLDDALRAKRAQENFMDMVAHEMRNPLSAMLQCAEEATQIIQQEQITLSNHEADTVVLNEALNTIQWCGQHQRQIIDDVLTISKLDSDLLTLAPTKSSPSNIIDEVSRMFTSEAKAADIQIVKHVSPEAQDQYYMLDSSRVRQILINLVGNAIKFTRNRPIRTIQISVSSSPDEPQSQTVKYVTSGSQDRQIPSVGSGNQAYVSFSVQDTGPGLTTDEMNSLFSRFTQASPRTHAQYGGSGLGLFISRNLSELHGGKIGLSSQVGKGSKFTFFVQAPAAKQRVMPKPVSEKRPATSSADPDVKSQTLLIVEDNLVNQKVLVRQIRKLGFKTDTADNGQEALSALKQSNYWHEGCADRTQYSVVLCDLEMPVMDGMTCIRHIRQWQADGLLSAHVPVVAVTGNARAEQVKAAKKAGFDEVVCKPYSVPDLIPIINRLAKGIPIRQLPVPPRSP